MRTYKLTRSWHASCRSFTSGCVFTFNVKSDLHRQTLACLSRWSPDESEMNLCWCLQMARLSGGCWPTPRLGAPYWWAAVFRCSSRSQELTRSCEWKRPPSLYLRHCSCWDVKRGRNGPSAVTVGGCDLRWCQFLSGRQISEHTEPYKPHWLLKIRFLI